MMSFSLTVEIPALDRLCAVLEQQDRAEICKQIKNEIIAQMRAAVEGGSPKPKFEEVKPDTDHPWKDEATTAPEPRKPAQEPPKPEPTNAPSEAQTPAPAQTPAAPVTLEAVQKAAAQMRDEGKLKAVTDMFPEFGVKKLSDLKGDKLQAFGERLRVMGAKL